MYTGLSRSHTHTHTHTHTHLRGVGHWGTSSVTWKSIKGMFGTAWLYLGPGINTTGGETRVIYII